MRNNDLQPFDGGGISRRSKPGKGFIFWTAVLLFAIIALGRGLAYIYSYLVVDITYDAWVPEVLWTITEILDAAKVALGYSAVAWAWRYTAMGPMVLVFLSGLLFENLLRFFIDYVTSAAEHYGIALTLISCGGRVVFEMFLLLTGVLCLILHKRKRKKPMSAVNGGRIMIAAALCWRIVSELLFYAQAYLEIGDMTQAEALSALGSILHIVVIYGGVPLLLTEAAFLLFRRIAPAGNKKQCNKEKYANKA